MVQFLLKLSLKQRFLAVSQFPLILRDKFHSFYVKESEILERSESDLVPPTPQPWFRGELA